MSNKRNRVAALVAIIGLSGMMFFAGSSANAAIGPTGTTYAYCTTDVSKVPVAFAHGYAVTQKVSPLNTSFEKVTICFVQPQGSKRVPGEIVWTYPQG